jgi:hypothetical protein
MSVELDEQLAKLLQEMHEAEDKLIEVGFPEEHWMLIRKYVTTAIGHMQLLAVKGWEQLQPPNPDS